MGVIRTGGCQCGAVRFKAAELIDNSHVCHCRMCQKATGNFFAALVGVPDSALTWTRGTPAVFLSSVEVERGFCRECGTPLFYHHTGGRHHSLCIGAFDDPAAIPLSFEAGPEGRLPQIDQLGKIEMGRPTEAAMGAEADRIRATNRQHPDHDTDAWPVPGSRQAG